MAKKEKAPKGARVQKPLYKKWWFWVVAVSLAGGCLYGLVGGGETGEPPTGRVETQPPAQVSPEPSKTPEAAPAETTPEPVETETPESQEPVSADFVLDVDALSVSDVGPLDTGNLTLKNGDLLSVNYGGDGVVVVKGKIQALFTNDQTVKQNYFSVCDLIKNHGFNTCQELQYWAVADMSNGEESKVISFTLDRATIEGVMNGNIIENQLGNYVADLYIHQSLK